MPGEPVMDDCFAAPNDAILARLALRRTGRPVVPRVSDRMRSWLREVAALHWIHGATPNTIA
jgi:hypothetical protein